MAIVPGPGGYWFTLVGTNGRTVATNAYEDYTAGARFVAVREPGQHDPVLHVLSEQWGRADDASAVMRALWATAAGGAQVADPEFGLELTFDLPHGAVRCCPQGTYVRVVDRDGDVVTDGSAYWVVDEWVEDPELVMGAIIGAAGTRQSAPQT